MKKLNFKVQFRICIGILILCFVLAILTKQGWFSNIAWISYGLFFAINPVWPQWFYGDPKMLKLGCRIAGILAIVIGLITRFGV